MSQTTGNGGEPAVHTASVPAPRRSRRRDTLVGGTLLVAIIAAGAGGAWLLKPKHAAGPSSVAMATATAPPQKIMQPATAPRAPASTQVERQAELIPHAAPLPQLPDVAPLPSLRKPVEPHAVEPRTTQGAPEQKSAQAAPEARMTREPAMVPLSSGDTPKPVTVAKAKSEKRKASTASKSTTQPHRKVAQAVRTADAGFGFWTPTAVKVRPLK